MGRKEAKKENKVKSITRRVQHNAEDGALNVKVGDVGDVIDPAQGKACLKICGCVR